MVNKISPGGRGGAKKFKKGINIFSKKGFLRGGTNVAKGGTKNFFLCAYARKLCPPPLNKSPRTPLVGITSRPSVAARGPSAVDNKHLVVKVC